MPVIEEEDPNVYKDGDDSEIDTLFKESNLLQATGNVSPSTHVEEQDYISNPSHSPEFFTLHTDVRGLLIRELYKKN